MWSSIEGFLLVAAAGFCWIGIGVAVSCCSARGWNYNIVQGLNSLGSVLISLALLAFGALRTGSSDFSLFGFALCALGGFANFYNYVLTGKAMARGPNGLVWGIMQSGLVGAFLMGVIFFGEKPTLFQLAGLLLILGGVLAMGIAKNNGSAARGKRWVPLALGALLLAMTTQCCNTLPSYFPEMGKNGILSRMLGSGLGSLLGFAITTLPGMIRKRDFGGRGEWIIAGILILMGLAASFFFFFRGLDRLAEIGCAGLGYPLAIGVCVIGFSLYSLLILKEKFARASLAGLGAACLGIILIAIR